MLINNKPNVIQVRGSTCIKMASPQGSLQELTLRLCRRLVTLLTQFTEGHDLLLLDSLIFIAEQLYRCLNAAREYQAADIVAEATTMLTSIQNEASDGTSGTLSVARITTGRPGRPRFAIAEDQLCSLLQVGFSVPLLGTSVRTIRRRMEEFGLSVSDFYSSISDNDLDGIVIEVLTHFPNSGYRMMAGHLRRHGIRVQQQRIRESLHRVAPASIAVRWNATLVRRIYSVTSPLALWHVDVNHKLIRYFFVADKECANDVTSSYVPVYWKAVKVDIIVLWGCSMTCDMTLRSLLYDATIKLIMSKLLSHRTIYTCQVSGYQ